MKKKDCIDCDRPLFDQNPDETRPYCDNCIALHENA